MTARLFVIENRERVPQVCAFLERLRYEKPVQVVVSEWKPRRTDKQNARYWVLLTLIADHVRPEGTQFPKEAWHEYFKRRLLTPVEVRLPNGKVVQDYPSTATMNRDDFTAYATQTEVWANERGVVMPDQGD